MMHGTTIAAGLGVVLWATMNSASLFAAKDQSRIEASPHDGRAPYSAPGLPGIKFDPETAAPQPAPGLDGEQPPGGEHEFGPLQAVETIELDEGMARRALDALADVRTKYDDAGLAEYETLEEFVAKTKAGKQLEVDIKRHGFASVTDWSAAILSVQFAYGAVLEDLEAEVRMQIEETRNDQNLTEQDRKIMIESLTAMLSTPGNKKVVRELMKDASYAQKLKQLDEME